MQPGTAGPPAANGAAGQASGAPGVTLTRCRVREILERIGDKWSLFVISCLGDGPKRFTALKRSVDGISQRMLTVTLVPANRSRPLPSRADPSARALAVKDIPAAAGMSLTGEGLPRPGGPGMPVKGVLVAVVDGGGLSTDRGLGIRGRAAVGRGWAHEGIGAREP
jgi:HxlR-like helix-turn-helix